LCSAKVVRDAGSGETEYSPNPEERDASRELTDHEGQEGHVEKEEDGNQDQVGPQRCQKEDEGEDAPGGQKYSDSIGELARMSGIGSLNTEGRMKEGSIGHPKTTVRAESSRTKQIAVSKVPHPSSELGSTTDKTGHADDSIRDGDAAGLDVVHREDKAGGSDGEYAKGTRVCKALWLGRSIVDIGVDRKSNSGASSAGVVVLAGDVTGVVDVDRALLTSEVVHGGDE